MFEQSTANPEEKERRSRLAELIRTKGFESDETQKAFLGWRVETEHKVQRARDPAEQGKLDALFEGRMKFLAGVLAEEESCERVNERLAEYDGQHKSEDYAIERFTDREGELMYDVEAAEIFADAGRYEEAVDFLETTLEAAQQELAAAETQEDLVKMHRALEYVKFLLLAYRGR